MLIGQRRGYFLILFEKKAKLLARDWFLGCLAKAYVIEKLLLKIFRNNAIAET